MESGAAGPSSPCDHWIIWAAPPVPIQPQYKTVRKAAGTGPGRGLGGRCRVPISMWQRHGRRTMPMPAKRARGYNRRCAGAVASGGSGLGRIPTRTSGRVPDARTMSTLLPTLLAKWAPDEKAAPSGFLVEKSGEVLRLRTPAKRPKAIVGRRSRGKLFGAFGNFTERGLPHSRYSLRKYSSSVAAVAALSVLFNRPGGETHSSTPGVGRKLLLVFMMGWAWPRAITGAAIACVRGYGWGGGRGLAWLGWWWWLWPRLFTLGIGGGLSRRWWFSMAAVTVAGARLPRRWWPRRVVGPPSRWRP